MINKICFFGLLHIKKDENIHLNFKSKNNDHKILVYLKNAIILNQQLKNYGYDFILFTNEKIYLDKLQKKLNYKLKLKQLSFRTYVPRKTHFYACHFRVDVFRYLSSLKRVYSVLIDLDVLILKNPKKLYQYKKDKINLINNITKNVIPAYGEEKILKNLKILNHKIKKVEWYGGDFFSGNSHFYKILHQKTKFYQKKFVKNIGWLSDQTDELFMSAAINEIKYNNLSKIKNVKDTGIFTRYWNTNVKHTQKKALYYQRFNILHIPADKVFLSKCYENLGKSSLFKSDYFAHVLSVRNIFKKNISKILPKQIKIKIRKYFT